MPKPAASHHIEPFVAPPEQPQREVDVLRRQVEHLQRLATLGTLAAGTIHEINNILTPALAYAQLAKSNPDDPALSVKAIEKAIDCIESASRIAQQVLSFAGNREEALAACVRGCVQKALDCLGRDPAKDRVTLAVNINADAMVAMRPLALQQVLLNLIINACNAMRTSGGTLRINSVDRSDGTTQISVSDTGPGIPAEIASRLFQPFVSQPSHAMQSRSATSQAKVHSGTGLGLSICQRLIEEAGGTISATSKSKCGTTFTMVVPTLRSERAKAG
jgi:signal transduction histidine kinase